MKKLLFVALFTFSMLSFSQQREQGTIEVAPYVGYMTSFFNGEDVEDLESRGALNFGVKADYYFNDRWSLRSGVNYDSMGSKDEISELQLDYINIPLNANWHFGSTRKWNLNFGVTPGFLVKADVEGEDVKDIIKSFQLGVSYGIGYKLEVSDAFSILFDFQGLVGVTEVLDFSDAPTRLNAGSSFNIGGVFTF